MGGADRMGKPVAPTTRRIGIGAACLAMVGLLVAASIARDDWLARDVALEPDRTAAVAAPAPQDVPIAEPAPTAPESPERSRSARPVAPDVVAVPPVVPETLERVEPRTPLSPLGLATRQADLPPRPTLLPRPHAVAAGRFHSRGHVVTLAGIEIVEAEEKLRRRAGKLALRDDGADGLPQLAEGSCAKLRRAGIAGARRGGHALHARQAGRRRVAGPAGLGACGCWRPLRGSGSGGSRSRARPAWRPAAAVAAGRRAVASGQFAAQRLADQRLGFADAVKGGERAEAGAALLANQHLIDHLEEGNRDARPA
jgi:hypothetical protein